MVKKLLNVSIQTKIMGLVITLILSIIFSFMGLFLYLITEQVNDSTKKVSLQTAKTISYMPTVRNAFKTLNPSVGLQPIAIQIGYQVDAEFVVIEDREGKILTHPNPAMIGQTIPIRDNYKAIVFGGYYNIKSNEIIGPSLVGKAPIMNENGQVVGVVTVGYLIEDIESDISSRMQRFNYFAIAVIIIGVFASVLLARNIRKDTLGLEPRQIATLYRDRDAILSSINEGIIAMDHQGHVTLINHAAKRILNLSDYDINQSIQKFLPDLNIAETLEKKEKKLNVEMFLRDKVIILNLVPIFEDKKVVGVVATFRDKTEIREMINTLSEVRKYSEDLRSQTHEFTNKLYVISGFLQLGYYKDAIQMLQNEAALNDNNNKMVFDQIEDPKVQAILLGKIGKASERKIKFLVDENSSLGILPSRIETTQLSIIIGNLIDNAFDEVARKKNKKVSFFALDFGEDIIFEVTDNGKGIPEENVDLIFKQGYSTKGLTSRGYGLSNLKEVVSELNGTVQVKSGKSGTTFSVFIPKNLPE